jgi:hypothetical protein
MIPWRARVRHHYVSDRQSPKKSRARGDFIDTAAQHGGCSANTMSCDEGSHAHSPVE